MRRVLFVSASGELGGAERSLVELTSAVDRSRVEPFVLVASPCREGETPLALALRDWGVTVYSISIRQPSATLNPVAILRYILDGRRAARLIARAAEAVGADLVHANTQLAHLAAGQAAGLAGLPCVWHARDAYRVGSATTRLLARHTTAVVAVSGFVRDHLVGEGVPPDMIRVILNGIDLSPFPRGGERRDARERARRELGLAADDFAVGTAGAFVPWKRHEDFLAAFAGALELADPALARRLRAVVVGGDTTGRHRAYEAKLRRLASQLPEGRVVFTGWRDDVPRLLTALDVFVAASDREPFGRVVVEAMAAGAPVVATDSGARAEVTDRGRAGVLTPQGDTAAIARAVVRLAVEPSAARALARSGLAQARRFDASRVARELTALYDEIATGEAGPRTED